MFYNDRCCNNQNDYNKNDNYDRKNCCVKRVEETFFCIPSYYNEDRKEDKKQDECWEGTFKICPKNHNQHHNCENRDDTKQDYYPNRNRCCLCNLFRNCRW